MNSISRVSTSMRQVIELIAPERAKELLGENIKNRNISRHHVAKCARDMETGNWGLNPQPIVISKSGKLLDGQHRLLAVIKANKSVEFFVCYDADEAVQRILDKGRKRSYIDGLVMDGKKNAKQIGAAARNLRVFLADYKDPSAGATDKELDDVREKFSDGFFFIENTTHVAGLSRASFLAVLVYAYKAFPEEVTDFYEAVKNGVNLDETHPALHFRNWLINKFRRGASGSNMDMDIMKRAASALEGYISKRPMSRLFIGEAGTIRLREIVEAANEKMVYSYGLKEMA